jgi:hypothetical protein
MTAPCVVAPVPLFHDAVTDVAAVAALTPVDQISTQLAAAAELTTRRVHVPPPVMPVIVDATVPAVGFVANIKNAVSPALMTNGNAFDPMTGADALLVANPRR